MKVLKIALTITFIILVYAGISYIQKPNLSNVKITSAKKVFSSYEIPVFKLTLEGNLSSSVVKSAFAADEPLIKAQFVQNGNTVVPANINKVSPQTYTITPVKTNSFKPGKYTLNATIKAGDSEKNLTQDFTWGVLAINRDKAQYYPGETANFSIGVLNEKGEIVCDADVFLEVIKPDGTKEERETSDNSIKVLNQCHSKQESVTPDYATSIKLSQTGTYILNLTAKTANGLHHIQNSFIVSENIPFDIERISATRLYPKNQYPMTISIKANQDFKGNVLENIPSDFAIIKSKQDDLKTDYAAKIIEKDNLKYLSWQVDWKKGENYSLSYIYNAPDRSPDFFLIGNLNLINDNSITIYTEDRYWQLANDDTVVLLTTADSSPWSVPGDFNSSNNTVEAIGGGGGGAGGYDGTTGFNGGSTGGGGGGGGEYRKITNFSPSGGTVSFTIGTGGGGGSNGSPASDGSDGIDTTWNSTSVVAKGGSKGLKSANGATAGAGGAGGTGGTGANANYDGGAGGTSGIRVTTNGGGGGGGGGAGGTASVGTTASNGSGTSGGGGGAGGGASGGSAGASAGANGGNGSVWTDSNDSSVGGAGGGGGGGNGGTTGNNAGAAGNSGNYGAGGAGGGGGGGGNGGTGTGTSGKTGIDGIIAITYAPSGANVSGNAYSTGTTPSANCDSDSGTNEVHLRTNGATYDTSCSNSDGSFTFTGVSVGGSGTGMILWLTTTGAGTKKGSLSIRYDGTGDSTSNIFYDDLVSVTSDDTNPVTNSIMDTWDSGDTSAAIPYTVTSNNLTTDSGYAFLAELKSGVTSGSDVYNPGGTITTNSTGGDFTIGTNAAATIDTATSSIGGNFSVNSGATIVISADTTISKDITNNGTFTQSSGTITLNGSGLQTLAGSGSPAITFNNLTLSSGQTIKFTAGETFQINGLLTISNSTNIDSTSGSQWFINHQGTESIAAGSISNSGCDGSSTLVTVTSGTNGGNNGTCWDFPVPVVESKINGNLRINGSVRFK